ncbi:hypothetical protein ACFOSV_12695 [Algoriphagus namhaensis]|uniref:Protein NO VEIN C-terminal domain-containing protein n=1 Tax=Algoriphagus namhaensis TaxID=915353 RepID=A0ABV8ATN0_9BACT
MTKETFKISKDFLDECLKKYPNLGKNSHVGQLGILMVKEFFKRKYPGCKFEVNSSKIDLKVILLNGEIKKYEVKSTVDSGLAWSKLKVSSTHCYNALQEGMPLVRITKIGEIEMDIYFLICGIDFTLIPEPRYSVKKL